MAKYGSLSFTQEMLFKQQKAITNAKKKNRQLLREIVEEGIVKGYATKWFLKERERVENGLVTQLDRFVNEATTNHTYTNRTYNLVSSIGGILYLNGTEIYRVRSIFSPHEKHKKYRLLGNQAFDEYSRTIWRPTQKHGYHIVLGAAMGYAKELEKGIHKTGNVYPVVTHAIDALLFLDSGRFSRITQDISIDIYLGTFHWDMSNSISNRLRERYMSMKKQASVEERNAMFRDMDAKTKKVVTTDVQETKSYLQEVIGEDCAEEYEADMREIIEDDLDFPFKSFRSTNIRSDETGGMPF